MRIWIFIFCIGTLTGLNRGYSGITVPTNLNPSDRETAIKILGWGSSSKILSDPYPLGGYTGVEVGLSMESIAISDLGRLGNKTDEQNRFTFPKISVGKGLYKDIDVYFHFIPFNETAGLSEFGSIIRFGIFQTNNAPISLALLIHGNSSNFRNLISTQSFGTDLVVGINTGNSSFYMGVGPIYSEGTFRASLTNSGLEESSVAQGVHSIIGATYRAGQFFSAIELNHYERTALGIKLGIRN